MASRLFVANWKMAKDFAQATEFCITHKENFQKLCNLPNTQLVLCPSFPSLFSVAEILSDTLIDVGAQTCSPHENGPYTGQVNAQSIAQTGCTYCIIGHSEQRQLGITDELVAQQATRLLEQNLEPIICVGEDKSTYDNGTTINFLDQQLVQIKPIIAQASMITIAYEPIWAIGTGVVPEIKSLTSTFDWLAQQTSSPEKVRLIYGGSVSPENAQELCQIPHVEGFLIGSDSLDFQKFEKIVSLAT